MAENENTFLSANEIYEEVEGEAGKSIVLEEDQKINLVGIIQVVLLKLKNLDKVMKLAG